MPRDLSDLLRGGGESWLEFLDLWSGQKPWWNWYLTPVVNFGEVRRAQLAKSTHVTSWDLFRSFKICSDAKWEWGADSNGKLSKLLIPSKTTTLVPEFAVEDLPLGRTVTLVPAFAVKDLLLGRTLMMMMMNVGLTRGIHKVSFPLVPQLLNQLQYYVKWLPVRAEYALMTWCDACTSGTSQVLTVTLLQ